MQGRDTPSPGDTPYLCRQRNSAASFNNRVQELSEMESGHLLASAGPCTAQVMQQMLMCLSCVMQYTRLNSDVLAVIRVDKTG
jgi:hypothetical protein